MSRMCSQPERRQNPCEFSLVTELPPTDIGSQPHGSQLHWTKKLGLLIYNPRDVFQLLSKAERRRDAALVFVLYLLVRLPVVLQHTGATGPLLKDGLVSVIIITIAVLLGCILAGGFIYAMAWVLHLLVNKSMKAGRTYEDMVTVMALSLAPQLLMLYEVPGLFLDFHDFETAWQALIMRLALDLLALRTFYWGLVIVFGLSKPKALAINALPIIIITVSLILALFADMGPRPPF